MAEFRDIARRTRAVAPSSVALPSPGAQLNEQRATERDLTARDLGQMVSQDWIVPNLRRALADSGFEEDPSWSLPLPNTSEGKELWAGIASEDTRRFLHARSAAHFDHLKREYQRQRELEQQLAATGGSGLAARFLLNIADPVGLAASLASGPAGWIAKGGRMAAFARAGTVAAGVNMALETAALSGSMTRDTTDVLLSGLFGFGLGGMSGVLIRGAERARAGRILSNIEREVIADDLVDAARRQGQVVSREDALRAVDEIRGGARAVADDAEQAAVEQGAAAARTARAADTADEGRPAGSLLEATGLMRRLDETEPERAARVDATLAEAQALLRGDAEAPPTASPEAPPATAPKAPRAKKSPTVEKLRAARDKAAAALSEAETARGELSLRAASGFDVDPAALAAAEQAVTRASQKLDRALAKLEDAEGKAAVVFGPDDSVGAMRATAYRPVRDDEFLEDIARRTGMTAKELTDFVGFGGFAIRYDYASVLRGIDDPELRGTLGLLVGDPVGPKDRGVNLIGATEEASRLSKVYRSRVIMAGDDAYEAWLAERGANTFRNRFDPAMREDFMRRVGLKLSGLSQEQDRHVDAYAAVVRRTLDELGDELVTRGILDAKIPNYFPRKFMHERLEAAHVRFHSERLDELFFHAVARGDWGRAIFREFDREFAENLIRKVSKGYHKRIREVGREIDVEMLFGVSGRDLSYLEGLLRDADVPADEIVRIVQAMEEKLKKAGKDDAGRASFAKHRLSLDESVEFDATVRGGDGGDIGTVQRLRLSDLLEKNAEIVVSRYIDTTTGRIAIQKITGIEKDADFQRLINAAKSRIADPDQRKKYVKYATDAYDYLVGRPLEADPDGRAARYARMVRNFNMARVGSTFGLAQIADLGNVVAVGGVKALLVGVKDFRKLLRRDAAGQWTDSLRRELSEFAGLGLDHHSTSLWTSEYGDIFSTREGKAEFAARGMSRFVAVASGMTKINEWSQVLVGRMMVNRFYRGRINEARLKYLGLTREEADAVIAELRRHATLDENGNVASMGLSQWSNGLLRDQFVQALRKAATRAVQENDFGATFPFMHSTLGKIVTQFRNFILVAWSKQTLHTAYMMGARDFEAYANVMWSLFFGGLSYAAFTAASSPPEDWEERFTPERIAAASFARSGLSSLLPTGIDTIGPMFGADPLFSFRSTGLPSNAFAGIPTVDLVNRMYQATTAAIQSPLDAERAWSEKDMENVRRLLPLSNFWGVPQLSEATAEAFGLPEEPR